VFGAAWSIARDETRRAEHVAARIAGAEKQREDRAEEGAGTIREARIHDDNESRGYSNYPAETRYGVREINDRRVHYVTSRANTGRSYRR